MDKSQTPRHDCRSCRYAAKVWALSVVQEPSALFETPNGEWWPVMQQWSTCWFVQLCLANVALNNIMGAMYRHFHPPTPRAVFNRFMSDQLILASLMAYWGLFPYVPYVVSESIFYLTLGDELLRLLLGGLLVFLGTSLGLFILLLGMKRCVSGQGYPVTRPLSNASCHWY
jgi:hypothetical protein